MSKAHLKLVTPASHAQAASERGPENPRAPDGSRGRTAHGGRSKEPLGTSGCTMVLVAYRHGFRPAELVDLRWDQIDFASGTLHVRRVKRGTPSTHPILGDELRALRRLQREQEPIEDRKRRLAGLLRPPHDGIALNEHALPIGQELRAGD